MITLYAFGTHFGVVDPSPFVLKIDLYLRVAGIVFDRKCGAKYLQKAPKGKLPFIEDNGCQISDSQIIIEYLRDKYSIGLDQSLTAEQKASAHLITKSLDENFYWCIVYSRWIRDDTWPIVKEAFFSDMPFPLKHIIPLVARKDVRSALHKQGIGRHSDEEIMDIARDTLESLSVLLGDKPYFFGDKITSIDISVFAFVAELVLIKLDNPMILMSRTFSNLVNYCERIQQQYYPELLNE